MPRISLASYCFHNLLEAGMIDVFGYIEVCRSRFHLSSADIWNGFLHPLDYDPALMRKIRQALDAAELTLENLCCDWCHPYAEDEETLAKQNQSADMALTAAEILGARTIRIDLGVPTREISDEQVERVSRTFRAYCKRAAQFGMAVAIENHWGASRRKCVQKLMREAVNEANFGQLLHLGNWDLDEMETLEGNDNEMAPFAVHSHVTHSVVPDADRRIADLLDAGYKGALSVEAGDGKLIEFEHAAFVLAATKRAVALWKAR